jgi:hypothetical protein
VTRAITGFAAGAAAWLAVVHLALGVGLLGAAGFIGLIALAAYGVGYELDDPGAATAMFAGLAPGVSWWAP